ncbi:hypothetical protein EVAR_98060_1 [Eumeta japonica]|uniref:Uncharacterized protein n=1 Tax=Eumeta variegata TaxID=151549 RepID=A0A4C1WBV9_EUMVA|nr:hypothetical protein EVAR_98060_1 [Eumeta japonica]
MEKDATSTLTEDTTIHPRFSDDSRSGGIDDDLSAILRDLSEVSREESVIMNMNNTKIMSYVYVLPIPVIAENSPSGVVDEYVYLEQAVRLGRFHFDYDGTRIQLGWASFEKL